MEGQVKEVCGQLRNVSESGPQCVAREQVGNAAEAFTNPVAHRLLKIAVRAKSKNFFKDGIPIPLNVNKQKKVTSLYSYNVRYKFVERPVLK